MHFTGREKSKLVPNRHCHTGRRDRYESILTSRQAFTFAGKLSHVSTEVMDAFESETGPSALPKMC